ncbi:MAG TPA: hypothetical protein VKV27_07455 [Solirubrobacteraceae bacterium]|nr:hypothetical protein [Solirubrobacteraceae bacterium]
MSFAQRIAPPSAAGLRLAARRLAVAGPVLVVALALALLIGSRLADYHGDPAGFILFGQRFVRYTHPPAAAPVLSRYGYDGQFYWIQAGDPLLLDRSTLAGLAGFPGYHLQRPAYPALAWLVALGRRSALPWAMLAVNVLAVLGLTAALAVFCARRGRSVWWALAAGALPGVLMPALRDLTDPLATATLLCGLLAWRSQRRFAAAALLAVSVLSRETGAVAVAAIMIETVLGCVRARADGPRVRALLRRAWPPLLIPTAAYAAWQAYLRLVPPTVPGAPVPAAAAAVPTGTAGGLWRRVEPVVHLPTTILSGWELVVVLLALAAMVTSAFLARRCRAAGVASLGLAATMLVAPFVDQWALARYTAPLFGVLLIAGLEQRSRAATAIAAAAGATSLLLPWVIAGI